MIAGPVRDGDVIVRTMASIVIVRVVMIMADGRDLG